MEGFNYTFFKKPLRQFQIKKLVRIYKIYAVSVDMTSFHCVVLVVFVSLYRVCIL